MAIKKTDTHTKTDSSPPRHVMATIWGKPKTAEEKKTHSFVNIQPHKKWIRNQLMSASGTWEFQATLVTSAVCRDCQVSHMLDKKKREIENTHTATYKLLWAKITKNIDKHFSFSSSFISDYIYMFVRHYNTRRPAAHISFFFIKTKNTHIKRTFILWLYSSFWFTRVL